MRHIGQIVPSAKDIGGTAGESDGFRDSCYVQATIALYGFVPHKAMVATEGHSIRRVGYDQIKLGQCRQDLPAVSVIYADSSVGVVGFHARPSGSSLGRPMHIAAHSPHQRAVNPVLLWESSECPQKHISAVELPLNIPLRAATKR